MNSKKKDNNELDKMMKDLISFKTKEDKEEFDIVIVHLEIMNKIQQLLENNKKNRQWLSEQLSVSKSYISQLFAGDKLLNLKLLVKINKIFKTNIQISFSAKNSFVIDAKSRIIDLAKIHPGFLGSQKFKDVQKSNDSVPISEDYYNQIMV